MGKLITIQLTNGKAEPFSAGFQPISEAVVLGDTPKVNDIICLDPDRLSTLTREARQQSKSYLEFDKYYKDVTAVDSMYDRVQFTGSATLIVQQTYVKCKYDPAVKHENGQVICVAKPITKSANNKQ